jgi:curli production assembly/transport component CsgG
VKDGKGLGKIMKNIRRGMILLKHFWVFALVALLVGCSAKIQPIKSSKAQLEYKTQIYKDLVSLPPPKEPIVLVVYKFRDQTGQYKPGTGTTGWSTAVTQGATSMLIKALQDAGAGKWFTVLERESLPNLLNERKIIRQTRKQYAGGVKKNGNLSLPPLLFAPILLEGGVIAYESNLLTGGLGARYLGIGGSTKYARDTVTIYLRAVSVKNGRIIKSVNTSKTIFSFSLDGSVFKFIGFKDLLEAEAGFTTNEPPQMAVLEAIEKGVYSMIIEGVTEGLWSFQDPVQGKQYVEKYLKEKYATVTANFDENGKLKSISTGDTERRTRRRVSLDLPVVPTGEVIGKVLLSNDDSKTGAANAQLQLVDASGKVVQEVKSSFGGFYQFAKVPLGKYILRVSPEQAQRLNLKPPPEQQVILNANKPALSGIDITIEPAPKVEIESRTSSPLESKQLASSRKRYFKKPSTKNITPKPESSDPKAKPIRHQEQSPPQKIPTPAAIRQMGSSWGAYVKK